MAPWRREYHHSILAWGTRGLYIHGVANSWTQLSDFHNVKISLEVVQLRLSHAQESTIRIICTFLKAKKWENFVSRNSWIAFLSTDKIHHLRGYGGGCLVPGRSVSQVTGLLGAAPVLSCESWRHPAALQWLPAPPRLLLVLESSPASPFLWVTSSVPEPDTARTSLGSCVVSSKP